MSKIKVLLVEDDIALGYAYAQGLQHLGFEVHYTSSYIAVLEVIDALQPNIIVLDVEIGDKNGIDESKDINRHYPNIPIIFISSHCEIEYIKKAVEQGCATYLKKPFDIEELAVYIERYAVDSNLSILGFGHFTYDLKLGELFNNNTNKKIKLTTKEERVLSLLIKNINAPLSREKIASELWHDQELHSAEYMITNIVSNLRKILASDPTIQITTLPKIGYKFITQS